MANTKFPNDTATITPLAADSFLTADASDSNAPKKVLVSGLTTYVNANSAAIVSTISGTAKGLSVINAGTGDGINVDQNGEGRSLYAVSDCTTADGIRVDVSSLTTGRGLYVYSNSAGQTGANGLARIYNNNGSSDGVCLAVVQGGTGNGILVDHDNSGVSLNIDQDVATHAGNLDWDTSSIVRTNTASGTSTNTGALLKMENVMAVSDTATDTTKLLELIQDADSTGNVIDITNPAVSRGINIAQTGIAPAMYITSSVAENSLNIDQNGNVGTAYQTDGALWISNSGNTGIGLNIYTNINGDMAGPLVSFASDNVLADEEVLYIHNDSVGDGMFILNTNALAKVINIDAENTTADAINVQCDAITTGVLARLASDSADATARNLLEVINDNTAAVGAVPLMIQQDAVVDTNFKKVMSVGGFTIFVSDGTTAEAALTGVEGDLCLNGGTGVGQAAFCDTTGTGWTDM